MSFIRDPTSGAMAFSRQRRAAKKQQSAVRRAAPTGVIPLVRLQEEAVSFYTKREAKLKEEYRKEKEKVHTKPLGMAFVTFQNEAMTAM